MGALTPPAVEILRSAFIAASEGQQLPLRIWQAASRGDVPEPMRHLPVVRAGISEPPIAIGRDVMQCRRVFV